MHAASDEGAARAGRHRVWRRAWAPAGCWFAQATPAQRADPALRRRATAVELGTLAMFAIGLVSIARYLSLGITHVAFALVLTMGACALNLLLLRRTLRVTLCGNVAVALLYGLLLVSIWTSGGFYDPNFAWLYTVPVAAALLVDLRSGWVWASVVMATTLCFWGLEQAGIVIPNRVPLEAQPLQALFNRMTAIGGLALLATSFAISERRAERELAASNRELLREGTCVQLLQHAAVAANEASSFDDALRACAQCVMQTSGWQAAHVWLPASDKSGEFVSSGIWLAQDPDRFAPLREASGAMRFSPGVGMVGRAIEERRPVWVVDGRDDPRKLPRARVAVGIGVHAAIAVPAASGDEVVAVLEFFSDEARHPDGRLLEVLGDVGRQVGRVAERMELNERLRQSQKLESVGQLAAGIAHEINNPMAYVRTNLGLLREEWAALRAEAAKGHWSEQALERLAECEELIDESLDGVDRTVAIVRDVKEFSGPAEGRSEPADLNELVEAALRIGTGNHGAGLRIERAYGTLPPVPCVPGQLRQVLLNLVVNACQAVDGRGCVRIETEVFGASAVVRVIDDGPGIDEHHLGRLFDPFFTTKRAGEGTGLGLFISYEIVRAHGGAIHVDSQPGRGARFEVRLPLAAV